MLDDFTRVAERLAAIVSTMGRLFSPPALAPQRRRSGFAGRPLSTRRVLVTGMSGTGKSSALAELRRLGFATVDTDDPGWTAWSAREGGYVWCESRIEALLGRELATSLFVSGTVSNQGRFYPRFDAVVLLSAPGDVLLSRIARRTNNPYGKRPGERELILQELAEVEPLLRRACTHEIDATLPLAEVVDRLAEIGATTASSARVSRGLVR